MENSKTSDYSVEFMLEEFRFLKASSEGAMAWRDERFKSYINIIFGTVALLAIIVQLSTTSSEIYYSVIIVSAILYLYGLFIFSRLLSGSYSIERYRHAINRVRKYFVEMDKNLEGYLLLPVDTPEPNYRLDKLGPGLTGTTAFTNSLLSLVFGIALCLEVGKWQIVPSVGFGLLLAVISWGLHVAYNSRQYKRRLRGLNKEDKQ